MVSAGIAVDDAGFIFCVLCVYMCVMPRVVEGGDTDEGDQAGEGDDEGGIDCEYHAPPTERGR